MRHAIRIREGRSTARRHGFTLLELLVVIAILAILAVIVASNMGGARKSADCTRAFSEVKAAVTDCSQTLILGNPEYADVKDCATRAKQAAVAFTRDCWDEVGDVTKTGYRQEANTLNGLLDEYKAGLNAARQTEIDGLKLPLPP